MSTTYYRDGAVHINSAGIRVDAEWYPLSSLDYVWHRRTARLRQGGYMLLTRGGALVLLVALLAIVGLVARRVDLSGGARTSLIAGGILAVVVLGGVAAFGAEALLGVIDRTHDHGGGRYEIWVRPYDGADMMIYRTSDVTRFGQIYRALQRAIEHSA